MVLKINKYLILSLCLVSLPAFAELNKPVLDLDSNQSSAEFLAVGRPSMLKIKGKGPSVSGGLQRNGNLLAGQFKVDLDQFNTGIDLRDRHMKEKYLETGKPGNRFAVLDIQKVDLSEAIIKNGGDQKAVPFSGKLSLHGTQKDVHGTMDISMKNRSASGIALLAVKLSDYAIALPTFAGATVAEDVNIEVHFQGKVD